MRYFRYQTAEQRCVLYPLVCWHVGAPQADYEFIDEMIYRLKHDPHGKGIYLGDGGECVTKSSKGMIYDQTMPPQEQLNWLKHRLLPVRDKLLFGVKGNHGWRTFKESGLGFDESLCLALQIPYLGTSVFWNLVVYRGSFDIFTHHGLDSGVAIGTKINKAKKFEEYIIADSLITAHSHICTAIPPTRRAYLHSNKSGSSGSRIQWLTTHGYICGSAYDSRTGYAEDKGYPPLLPAHMAITFHVRMGPRGKYVLKRQTHEIIDVDANKERQPNRENIIARMQSATMTCVRHPAYTGSHKPRVACEECWRVYVANHP